MDWLKSKYCFHPPETSVAMMWKDGYRQVSRKERILARVDITPEELVKFYDGKIASFATEKQQKCYRRDHSPDRITLIPETIMMLMRRREKDESLR